jgi:hypothetical protein
MDSAVVAGAGARGIHPAVANASALRRAATSRAPAGQSPKRGMWVVRETPDGNSPPSILTGIVSGDVAQLMAVDELGLNLFAWSCPAMELRQAYLDEIPERRRPDLEHAAALGYWSAP